MNSNEFLPKVDQDRCSGCGRCVASCPERLFTLEISGYRKFAAMAASEQCTRCMRCRAECPVGAIIPH